jgi:hypothetical protein
MAFTLPHIIDPLGRASTAGAVVDVGSSPARLIVPVTLADADLPNGVCTALWCGGEGLANLMDAEGNIRTGFPLFTGLNQISARQVRTGTAATNIWALYSLAP